MRISGIIDESVVDGPGVRVVVFFQGCVHDCPNCQNKDTHDPLGGEEISLEKVMERIKNNPHTDGVTLSGGEPLYQLSSCLDLVKEIKKLNLNIIVYTGYDFEEILEMGKKDKRYIELLKNIDCLIDGRYIDSLRDISLKYIGSSNQRIIDPKKSLKKKEIVLLDL